MKKTAAFMLAALACTGMACKTSDKQGTAENEKESPKCLVLYYSETGATKAVAEEIKNILGAEIEAIEAVNPYPGDFMETIARCNEEIAKDSLPEIKPIQANIADYDVIFLGYPVWYGTYARPVMTLVANEAFEGKTIVPFCTFGSGGLESTSKDLAEALPKAKIAGGYGVRNARVTAAPKEIKDFLIINGYIEGEVVMPGAFSDQEPVSETETAIFNAACSDYQFPLGTPVSFGKRSIEGGTEYMFTVQSPDRNGNPSESVIYVNDISGEAPVFTRVVR